MVIRNYKSTCVIKYNDEYVTDIYRGTKLVFHTGLPDNVPRAVIECCFEAGYWINNLSYLNGKAWKNFI